jgi:[ribosomal protein S5]-alanine N-acetyltransferase
MFLSHIYNQPKTIALLYINFTPFPVITTQRLILRKLSIKDAEEIMLLRSDERVNKFIDRPKSIDLNEAKKFIEKIENGINNNEWVYWAITLKGNDALIGTICLWNILVEKDTAEIGYELYPNFQEKRLMQEAIKKIIDYGFNKMGLKIITAFTHPGNYKSTNLLLKNNFLLDNNNDYVSAEDAGEQSVYYLKKR